jgi:DNA adenine methylase
MTAYHGGKQRIGKELANIISDYIIHEQNDHPRKNISPSGYCEPFCGMLGVYRHIPDKLDELGHIKYTGSDINKSLILMWKECQSGWKPPTQISKQRFDTLKYDKKYSAIKGFVGFTCTYRGVFFDSYFPHSSSKIKHSAQTVYDIANNDCRNVKFKHGDYKIWSKLKNYIIYCDPPYYDTEQRYYKGNEYKDRLDFDHQEFWDWCSLMSKNNTVFISEYKDLRRVPVLKEAGIIKLWSDAQNKEKLFVI